MPRQVLIDTRLFLAALTLAAPTLAEAQQDTLRTDTAVFRIEGIRIQAERPVTTIGGASAIEVTVDSLGLPAAPTAEEVLRELPAVHIRTNSRGQAEISVRGSESRQVAVLLDGVPLTLGWDARTDVSVLPAGAAREVNFVRGLSTILHGPNVLGGVVEMNVALGRDMPERASAEASASYDGTGGYASSATAGAPFETLSGRGMVRAGVGYRDLPGFPLPGGVTEPVATGGDLRLNTDVRNLDGFFAARYARDGGAWTSLSATSHRAERGIAGELGAQDPRLWRYPHISRTIVATSAGTGDRATPWGRGDLEMSLGLDGGRTEIESFATRAYENVIGREEGSARTTTARLLGDHTLGERADLRGAFTFADIRHTETTDGIARDYRQRLFSVGTEVVWRILEHGGGAVDALRLSVGGAWDRGSTPESGGLESLGTIDDWGGRLGLSALANDGNTLVHAGVSRRGRFPALREAYSEALNRFVPNPELSPEHLVSVEAGVTSRVASGDLQVVAFHNRLTDAIRRITFADGKRQRVNADELRSTGVELFLSQTFGSVAVGGDLTLQAVSLTAPGSALSKRPENLPERSGSAYVRLPLLTGITLGTELEYTGPQYCQDPDTGTDVKLDGGSWLNATLRRLWNAGGRRVESSLSALNLGDATLYDQCGLPRAGRLFRLQLRIS